MNFLNLDRILLLTSALMLVTPAVAREEFPETTEDGLQLQYHSSKSALYVREGARLSEYTRVQILDCYVEFKKNWQRDFNRSKMGLDHQLTDSDLERIRKEVADALPVAFSSELEKGGFEVVDQAGAGVLVLRPAIINLSVVSPNTYTAGSMNKVVRSSGTMTLYMEIYDAASGTKVAEAIDSQDVGKHGLAQSGDVVTNNSNFFRTMQQWANTLIQRLDETKGESSG